jgi:hypothetical protein
VRDRFGWSLAVLAAALAACSLPAPLVQRFFPSAEAAAAPAAADCERCHQEVYREWEASPHARAFRHEAFQAASAGAREATCVGCHAAAPLRADAAPQPRAHRLDEGVTCVTCHLAPDATAGRFAMRGPVSRTSPVEVHPVIEGDPLYRSSELCGTCHRATLAEWRAAPEPAEGKPSCQSCHMPAVRRKVENPNEAHPSSTFFSALGDVQELRRHAFAVPEPRADDLRLEAQVAGGRGGAPRLRLALHNGLPHDLPTGDFGRRELRVVARWPGGEEARSRARRRGEALAAGTTWRADVALPPGTGAGEVETWLERWDTGSASWQVLARAGAAPDSAAARPGAGE